MLIINRYENRQTGKVTIQAHVIKGKKLIRSYAPCCHSLIDMIAQNYSFYLLCDVDYYSKLKTVKIVNAWKWEYLKMSYIDIVTQFKGKVDFKFMVIIDNETLKTKYSILSNLYCDPPRIVNDWLNTGTYTKKQYRKQISLLKKALNKSVVLHSTNNDQYYTRLVYKFK